MTAAKKSVLATPDDQSIIDRISFEVLYESKC